MSITDPSAEPAQPDEGQGAEASGGSPWESYLTRFPEEVRDDAASAFREMEVNANKRLQDAAEFRKQWEPLAETGVNQLQPEQVAYAVQLFQALEDPKVMQQWWEGYAQQNGLTPAQQAQVDAQTPTPGLDDFGFQDPQQQFEKLLEERLGPLSQQLEQFGSRFAQQDQAQREQEALRYIEGQVAELETKHGAFDDNTKELLNTLAGRYVESDPMNAIMRAHEDLTRWRNDVEKAALQAKVDAPAPAETGGVPAVAPEQHSRIDSPSVRETALEYMRNMNRA